MIRIAVVDDEKECVIKIKKYLQAMNRSDLEYYLMNMITVMCLTFCF